jgi:transcriptional regulator with XRE-family HTH domain
MEMPPNRIEALRSEADHMSRTSLAVACEVGEMTIRRWERGESAVPDGQKFALAAHFSKELGREISVEFLMGWDRVPASSGKAA